MKMQPFLEEAQELRDRTRG